MYSYKNMVLVLVFFLTAFCEGRGSAFAQKKETPSNADKFFDNYEYWKAIPIYKRSAKRNDASLKRLADCYRMVKDYDEAETTYEKLIAKKSADPNVYYHYAEVLLANNKFDEAKKQFSIYATLNPDDHKGPLYAKACGEMKDLLIAPALYKVNSLKGMGINSEGSDFCPSFFNDMIVFASEREKDLVALNRKKYAPPAYITLVQVKESKRQGPAKPGKDSVIYSRCKSFSGSFRGDGHYGPACFSADGSEMFYTKVEAGAHQKRKTTSQSKLYWAKRNNNNWKNAESLSFNSNEYATGHPSISKDGQYLYFASNMPGGQGGTDIWVSKRDGNTWGSPKNLGAEINTKEDEAFPYISSNNTLYFSSKGHAGFGGLDLFTSVQKDQKWSNPTNLMHPINSSGDDFGILFKNDNSGYFSSNRTGGEGSDDLYGFELSGLITSISGKILLSNKTDDGAKHVKIFLLTDKGTLLQTTSTDASGLFLFENILADRNYTVRIDESDPTLASQKSFYLSDVKNKMVRAIVKGKNGFFAFENLPPDISKLSALSLDDVTMKKFSIAGNLYSGDQRKALNNAKVNLLNDKGEVIQFTTTNAFGSFVFMNISPDDNFTVALDEADPTLSTAKIYFTNKSGKEIGSGKGGKFRFQILASDTNVLSLLRVEDSQLLIDLKGTLYSDKEGKNKLINSNISLMESSGKVVRTSKTDGLGNFRFVNLPADKNYIISMEEGDATLTHKDIYLADGNGQMVTTLKAADGKFFRFSVLPTDKHSLANIYFDDPWLQVAKAKSDAYNDAPLTIIENIYYDYEKWDLLPQAIITLDKVIQAMRSNPGMHIEIIANTDSRGADDYNLKLSQKRAQSAVDYIISKGTDKNRLTAVGRGEKNPVNRCTEGVECTEEEFARNRRTEFNIKSSTK